MGIENLDDGIRCRAEYDRLLGYGDRLAVTLIAHTVGYAVRSRVVPPKEEADMLAWFFRDYSKLPFTLGVVACAVHTLPSYDGRQVRTDTTAFTTAIRDLDRMRLVLFYGSNGKLLYARKDNSLANLADPVLRRLIEREIKSDSSASSSLR